jgi:phospholipid transport system substrate-binding protein
VLSVCAGHAYAGEPTDQLKGTTDAVIDILKNKDSKKPGKEAERRAELRKVIDARFDFTEMSKRALALNWRKRTPEEQKEFVPLFSSLLEHTYVRKIERYNGEQIRYISESVDDGYATVRTRIITRRNTEIPVDYFLLKEGTEWLVYDVNIEGVSLVENYRTQFNEIISSSSYDNLVQKLRKKELKEPHKTYRQMIAKIEWVFIVLPTV